MLSPRGLAILHNQAKHNPQSGQAAWVVGKLHPQAGQVASAAAVLNTAAA